MTDYAVSPHARTFPKESGESSGRFCAQNRSCAETNDGILVLPWLISEEQQECFKRGQMSLERQVKHNMFCMHRKIPGFVKNFLSGFKANSGL